MAGNAKVAMNLSNSIIGVSILAMPFCMKMCGIFLGLLMLIFSALLTRFTCHLLLKSAVVSRRKSFEFLAFHTFGQAGKLIAELNIIGFMLGILVSFFVVIGDLGPAILSKALDIQDTEPLRTVVLLFLGLGAALPLAMLKELDSLARISTLSIAFYAFFAMKTIAEALPVLISGGWADEIVLWEPSGILQSLPIFSLALSCQTQIFEIYDSLPDPSLKHMNSVIKIAVNLCTGLYIIVGVFGYIANHNNVFTGNILLSFSPGLLTEIIKLFFVFALAMSFPLVIFPCRTSIHSLLYRRSGVPFDVGGSGIPQSRFKIITFATVCSTLMIGILCPNIEMVLGFIGSTIGILTCVVFPAMMFIRVISKNTFERWGAQLALIIGVILMASCTWVNVAPVRSDMGYPRSEVLPLLPEKIKMPERNEVPLNIATAVLSKESSLPVLKDNDIKRGHNPKKKKDGVQCLEESSGLCNATGDKSQDIQTSKDAEKVSRQKENVEQKSEPVDENLKRQEPPIPQEPEENGEGNGKLEPQVPKEPEEVNANNNVGNGKEPEKKNFNSANNLEETGKMALQQQEKILRKLEEQQKQQKILLDEQREILKELKAHERSHDKDEAQRKTGDAAEAAPKLQDERPSNHVDGALRPDDSQDGAVAKDKIDKPANIKPSINHSVRKGGFAENGGPNINDAQNAIYAKKASAVNRTGAKEDNLIIPTNNAAMLDLSVKVAVYQGPVATGQVPRSGVKDMVASLVLKDGLARGNETMPKQHSGNVPHSKRTVNPEHLPEQLADERPSEKSDPNEEPVVIARSGHMQLEGDVKPLVHGTSDSLGEPELDMPKVPFDTKKVGRDLKNELQREIGSNGMPKLSSTDLQN